MKNRDNSTTITASPEAIDELRARRQHIEEVAGNRLLHVLQGNATEGPETAQAEATADVPAGDAYGKLTGLIQSESNADTLKRELPKKAQRAHACGDISMADFNLVLDAINGRLVALGADRMRYDSIKAIRSEAATLRRDHLKKVKQANGKAQPGNGAKSGELISKDMAALWQAYGMTISDVGTPHCNLDNIVRVFHNHADYVRKIWVDEFLKRHLMELPNGNLVDVTDSVILATTLDMQRRFGLSWAKDSTVQNALSVVGHLDVRNCVREWLLDLKWDGTDRIETLFSRGFGASPTPYIQSIGRCFMIGMVARVLNPGCKLDTMVVLEGAQGKRKSSGLKALAGDHLFGESSEHPSKKEFFMGLDGKLLTEVAELDSFSNAGISTIKRVLSSSEDRYRLPYGKTITTNPRMGVFVGTTNHDDWISDQTGGRRFWPVACGFIDLEWIAGTRDQLFAEAVRMYQSGAQWWLNESEERDAVIEQGERRESSVWETHVLEILNEDAVKAGKQCEIRVHELLEKLNIEPRNWTKKMEMDIAGTLKAHGWDKRKEMRKGVRSTWWYPPGSDAEQAPKEEASDDFSDIPF